MKGVDKDEDNLENEEIESEDEIIINDEYYDEPTVINTVPSKELIPSSMVFTKEAPHSKVESLNETKDEECELNGYSQYYCFLNDEEENTEHIEYKYLEKLTELKSTISKLRDDNRKITMENKKMKNENKKMIEEMKEEIAKKEKEIKNMKERKNDKNIISKEEYERIGKEYQIVKKDYNDGLEENKKIKKELSESKAENDTLKFEITEKNEELREIKRQIKEMDNKLKELEVSNQTKDDTINDLKIENKKLKSNNRQQSPKEESKENSSSKEEIIQLQKSNDLLNKQLNDIQSKFDQAIAKIQKLTEDNYSLKQTIILSSSTPSLPTPKINNTNLSLNYNPNSESITPKKVKTQNFEVEPQQSPNQYTKIHNQNSTVNQTRSISSISGKKIRRSTVNNKTFTTTMDIFPSQKEQIMKESKILEIETALYKLQKERDKLNDDLSKIPEFPKKQAQINKRRSLELSIEEFNSKINFHKQKLRELNN